MRKIRIWKFAQQKNGVILSRPISEWRPPPEVLFLLSYNIFFNGSGMSACQVMEEKTDVKGN